LPGRILPEIAQLPLGALGVLSDTISYIRLMAVGLASTILGATFNLLAADISQVSVVLAGVVFVLGHSLNIALALVALFAHGVRLNMLEFSTHLGMNWTGYRFTPFCFAGKKE
jgi:V/A-type H+-transporting ATPase subunit I